MASTSDRSNGPKPPKKTISAKAKAKQKASKAATATPASANLDKTRSPKSKKSPKARKVDSSTSSKTTSPKKENGATLRPTRAPVTSDEGREPNKVVDYDSLEEPVTPMGQPAGTDIITGASLKVSKATQFYNASLGDISAVKKLIEENIDVDMIVQDPRNQGCTALLWASFYGYLEIVKVLVKAGADIKKTSIKHEHTAVFCSAQTGKIDVLRFLLDNGADANRANRHGATPLFMAVQGGSFEVLKALLSHDCDVNATTSDGQSALTKATQKGRSDIVTLLLEYGADVYNKNGKYRPLRVAKRQDVRKLIEDRIYG